MKTLQNQTLLYDEDCPLCNMYTTGFIKAGMLDQNGKKPFSKLTTDEETFIDVKRASNEIALVDTKNKTILYGIDSLLKVIGNSFPIIAKIGNWKPVKFLLKKVYSFISYNRKVILPNKTETANKLNCIPSFSYKYRFLYIVFATLFTALALYNFAILIPELPQAKFSRELIVALGQIVFQSLFLLKFDKKNILNYAGNLMTVSLMGSLLLTPLLVLSQVFQLADLFLFGWFGITVLLMFFEHIRRVKVLELPSYLSYTWILYRVIVLVILLNL